MVLSQSAFLIVARVSVQLQLERLASWSLATMGRCKATGTIQYPDARIRKGTASARAAQLRHPALQPPTNAASSGATSEAPKTIPTRGGFELTYPSRGAARQIIAAVQRM